MQKLLSIKGAVVTLGALVLSLVAIACGGNGASNNDQGMAVTFLGLFNSTTLAQPNQGGGAGGGLTAGQGGCGQLPSVFVGGAIRLGEAQPEPAVTLTDKNSSGTDESGAFVSVVGIQNNLYGQLFRADRVLIDYYVPGARAQPPSTNAPVALIAGPAESAAQTGIQGGQGGQGGQAQNPGLRKPSHTSLPPSLSNVCNRALAQVTVIPSAVREWLNFNRDLLPEAPFKIEITVRVSGLTSSGDRVETNDGTFDFEVLPETYVVPTSGDETPAATTTNEADAEAQIDNSGVEQLGQEFDVAGSTAAEG